MPVTGQNSSGFHGLFKVSPTGCLCIHSCCSISLGAISYLKQQFKVIITEVFQGVNWPSLSNNL